MKITSVQIGKETLALGETIRQPAIPARRMKRRNRQTGASEEFDAPEEPARDFTIDSFDPGSGGVRCKDATGSVLVVNAATALIWKVTG